jgi:hypothetical protein
MFHKMLIFKAGIGIDLGPSLPPPEPVLLNVMEPSNRFQGINSASLCSLAGRYDNPIPARFLVPIDCLKIPALRINITTELILTWNRYCGIDAWGP